MCLCYVYEHVGRNTIGLLLITGLLQYMQLISFRILGHHINALLTYSSPTVGNVRSVTACARIPTEANTTLPGFEWKQNGTGKLLAPNHLK